MSVSSAADREVLGARLRAILGEPRALLSKGPMKYRLPAVLGLTGAGSPYGLLQRDGLVLAAEHVAAWTDGALTLDLDILDHRSCLPEEAARTERLGVGESSVMITSFIFCFGTQVEALAEGRTLAIDPAGGTGPTYRSRPYCYGFRGSWPDDSQAGLWQVIRELNPAATRWLVVTPRFASGWVEALEGRLRPIGERLGIELSFLSAPYGATDYSDTVAQMKAADADVYVTLQYGADFVHTVRELERQKLLGTAIFATDEFTDEIVAQVGDLLDGWYIGNEAFDPTSPGNDWSQLFVDKFAAGHGALPQNYSASMYSTGFAVALLLERTIARGGDIDSAADCLAALEAEPAFPHLYGIDGGAAGQLVVDTATHSPRSIPLVAFRSLGSTDPSATRILATYDVGGRNVRVIDDLQPGA